ncbi:hypothetical protein NL676_022731 [Syzygium grande]|nr:hypothetical protein NL676_022731 [Syzygium grande]
MDGGKDRRRDGRVGHGEFGPPATKLDPADDPDGRIRDDAGDAFGREPTPTRRRGGGVLVSMALCWEGRSGRGGGV